MLPSTKQMGKETRDRGSIFAFVLVVIMGAAFVVPGSIIAGATLYYQYYGLIVPGISFQGIDLSGKTEAQAAQEIDRVWNLDRQMTVSDGTQTWSTTPGFFGLYVDALAIAKQAYDIGRGPDGLDEMTRLLHERQREVSPVIVANLQAGSDNLQRWAQVLNQPAKDAELSISNGQVTATASQTGNAVDIQKTLAEVGANPWGVMKRGSLTLYRDPVSPDLADVSTEAAQAKSLLSLHLGIQMYDPITDEHLQWEIPQQTLAGWVKAVRIEGAYQVSLDEGALAAYLQDLPNQSEMLGLGKDRVVEPLADPAGAANDLLQGKPVLFMVRHLPTEYIAKAGDTLFGIAWKVGITYWRMQKANPNLGTGGLSAGQKVIVPSPNDQLPLPVVPNKRIVISLPKQHMWIYQDGAQIKDFVVSTGMTNSATQPGVFQVFEHDPNAYASQWDLQMPYWLGIYEVSPSGVTNGIHELPILSNGARLWASVLGRPASYGCIILGIGPAEWVYNWAEDGVVVEIDR
ncbi:MAG: peptidoglycan binding domain-containing protein [Chloroflexi bacterium]|nr:peptidoglycan binding domain-containing protein [Chloroflexota bacterium]